MRPFATFGCHATSSRCFEAVKELTFEEDGEISGLISVEGEKIGFLDRVNPASTGAVERWLLEVESAMRRTLHKVAGEALNSYAASERSQWILEWPGQLVLNCSQVYWTREVSFIPDPASHARALHLQTA